MSTTHFDVIPLCGYGGMAAKLLLVAPESSHPLVNGEVDSIKDEEGAEFSHGDRELAR